MEDTTGCSLGIDLGQQPWGIAIAYGNTVDVLAPQPDLPSLADLLRAHPAGTPTTVVTVSSPALHSGNAALAAEIAHCFGLATDRVWTIDRADATDAGRSYLQAQAAPGDHESAGGVEGSAAAIGAALSWHGATSGHSGMATLAAAAGGGLVGGLGAAAMATGTAPGPAGSPLATGTAPGPAGSPLATGTAPGPAGIPLAGARMLTPHGRNWVIIAAVAAVAAVVVVVVVVAIASTNGDDAAGPTATVAATGATTAGPATEPTGKVAGHTISTPLTSPATVATVAAGAPCAVGSWTADNESWAAQMIAVSAGSIESATATGEIRVDIAADGTVVTTFKDFVGVATMPGAGTTQIAHTGTETSAILFADDGTYTVTASQINSTQTLSANGLAIMERPSPEAVFGGSGMFACTGDQLEITFAGDFGDFVQLFDRNA